MKSNKLCSVLLSITTTIAVIGVSLGTALIPAITSYAAVDLLSMNSSLTEEEQNNTEVVGEKQWQVIEISNAQELKALAKKCSLDTWSQDKYVKLTEDIHLEDGEFNYFATFGGIFDGNKHTIDGLVITADLGYLGLFSKLQPSGLIKNLTVKGSIAPEKKQVVVGGLVGDNYGVIDSCSFDGVVKGNDYTGGIVGYNETMGMILNCKSFGSVVGQHYTGGIAGANQGGIYDCINKALVNTTNVDKGMSMEDININKYLSGIIDFSGDTSEKKRLDKSNNVVDTGGIVGHSSGVVEYCTNLGNVGYERVGYNVGGIAGRQSGYLHGCSNGAIILGRKDVGGIVGQAEPYVQLDLTEDTISKITENINELHDLVGKTLDDSGDSSTKVSDRLSVVQKFVDSALDDTSYLSGETINYMNGLTYAGNEALNRADYAMNEAGKNGGAIDKSKDAMDDVNHAAENLDKLAKDGDIYSYMTPEETIRYDGARDRIKANSDEYNEYYGRVYANNYYYFLYADSNTSNELKSYYGMGSDADKRLVAYDIDNNVVEFPTNLNSGAENVIVNVLHADDSIFPDTSEEQREKDSDLGRDAVSDAETASKNYAEGCYHDEGGHFTSFEADIRDDAQIMADILSNHQSEMTEDARRDLEEASKALSSASENAGEAMSQSSAIVKDLNGRDNITLPSLDNGYKAHTDSFVANMQAVSENLELLNREMNDSSHSLIDDMSGVNDSFQTLMLLFLDAMDGALDGDYDDKYEDESFEVAAESKDGTVADCVNVGNVSGDLNVAGIAGGMGIEYDFDLEGDVTNIQDAKINSTFRTKCVLRKNKNEGRITAQKSYVGGQAGIQEMGTILYGENYGRIASNTGDYVGGIVGSSSAYVKSSYSKGIMSGDEYVGGIAGYGHAIYDSYTIPAIIESSSFVGAIAGEVDDEAKLNGNYFVSDDLAGIDRISYSGMAEPVPYKRLASRTDIPDAFKQMKITFLVEDEVIGVKTVDYGLSLVESQYPESILEKDYYIDWDTTIVHDVTADMEIIGEPVLYRTTIASQQLRENKQSVILVDGKFKDSQFIDVKEWETPAGEESLGNIVERWEVSVPRDGQDTHQFRIQLPEQVKKASIYVDVDGEYKKASTSVMGMYQLFDVVGEHADILVVDETTPMWKYMACGGAAVLLIGIVLTISIAIRRKKHPKPKKPSRKERRQNRKNKSKQAREIRKEKLESGIGKAQQLLEEAKDDSPRGEK